MDTSGCLRPTINSSDGSVFSIYYVSRGFCISNGCIDGKNRESDRILKKVFFEAVKSWKVILPTTVFFLITGFVVVIPLGIGLTYFIRFGNLAALLIGLMLSLFLIVGISFLSYFLPITLLEKGSFTSGFRKSMDSSKRSSKL